MNESKRKIKVNLIIKEINKKEIMISDDDAKLSDDWMDNICLDCDLDNPSCDKCMGA